MRDQHAYSRSLISALIVRLLISFIVKYLNLHHVLVPCALSNVSVAEQIGSSLTQSRTPSDEVHIYTDGQKKCYNIICQVRDVVARAYHDQHLE